MTRAACRAGSRSGLPGRTRIEAGLLMMASIAHYNLLERIGEGGTGEVFRARDTKVGRTVALKVVSPAITGDPGRLQRLLYEAHAPAALSQPNIATLGDAGDADGHTYLAYEF